MADNFTLQEGQGIDENLRPVRLNGENTSLEIASNENGARVKGDLEVTGDLKCNMNKVVAIGGGGLEMQSDSNILLNSFTGRFNMEADGIEFSPQHSAYAGMILGYTRIANDQTGSTSANITLSGSMTVIATTNGTNVSVTFVAPPSGSVEIRFSCFLYTSSTTVAFALSDNSTYNEVDQTHTYDAGAYRMDETDSNTITIPFAVTGLTSGTSYTYYIAGEETSGSTATIFHGRLRTTGKHYPPITVKAVALPSTITTGE